MYKADEIPKSFRYRQVMLKGRPQHQGGDAFLARHPPMDLNRRAKIFAPFDALRGFDEALIAAEGLAMAEETGAEGRR